MARENWVTDFGEVWRRYFPGSEPQWGAIGRALKPLVKRLGVDAVRVAWVRYLGEEDQRFINPSAFASKFSRWSAGPKVAEAKPERDETQHYLELPRQPGEPELEL